MAADRRDRHHPGAAGDVAELQIDQPHVLARYPLQQSRRVSRRRRVCAISCCHRSPLIRRRTPLGGAHKITKSSVLSYSRNGNFAGNSAMLDPRYTALLPCCCGSCETTAVGRVAQMVGQASRHSGRWARSNRPLLWRSTLEWESGIDSGVGVVRALAVGLAGESRRRVDIVDTCRRKKTMQAAPRSANRLAPLWDPTYERDSCGVGLVVDIAGRPSREIVERALAGLVNLTHRGGVGADSRTGDGAGVLTQVPLALFGETLAAAGHAELGPGQLGVAMTFLPRNADQAAAARQALDDAVRGRGLEPIVWRPVPTNPSALGDQAVSSMPRIEQLLIRRPEGMGEDLFERELFLVRKAADRAAIAAGWSELFVVSCSARTLIYKAFCLPRDLPLFYPDLQDPHFESAIVLFHQRYSTNTLPTWAMAQPFRFLAHNGEINTIGGNRLWMEARAPQLQFPDGTSLAELRPVVSMEGSDSLSLDDVVGLLYHGGRSLPHALMMLVPEPWEQLPEMDPARRAFYEFHAGLVEQWDGPAALGFSDGVIAGATLDRNGLRPFRYAITSDGSVHRGLRGGDR